jgi:hypothetical protein
MSEAECGKLQGCATHGQNGVAYSQGCCTGSFQCLSAKPAVLANALARIVDSDYYPNEMYGVPGNFVCPDYRLAGIMFVCVQVNGKLR